MRTPICILIDQFGPPFHGTGRSLCLSIQPTFVGCISMETPNKQILRKESHDRKLISHDDQDKDKFTPLIKNLKGGGIG